MRSVARQGLPPQHRGHGWFVLSGAAAKQAASPLEFATLCQRLREGEASTWAEEIEKDVLRTFPAHPSFAAGGPGRRALSELLCAYSLRNTRVGYCQGMNFLAAFALLQLDSERAFWLLAVICEVFFPNSVRMMMMMTMMIMMMKIMMLLLLLLCCCSCCCSYCSC